MTRKGKYVLASIAAATVGLAAAGAMAERGHYWDHYKWGGKERHARHHGGSMGLMGLAFGGPNYRICRGDPAEAADHMLVRIEHRVKPTEEQKGVFEEFKTAARAAAQKLHEVCPKPAEQAKDAKDGERHRRNPVERLAQTQAGLETSLEALKTFRPAAEKFYAALSDEQKQKLERRGRGGDKGKRHWKRDRGPQDGPGNERAPDGGPNPDDKT